MMNMNKILATQISIIILLLPLNAFTADFVDPVASMEFVLVYGGEYKRGDETGFGRENERPPHSVRVTDFFMGKYEVTVEQFTGFVNDTGHLTTPEKRGWVMDIDPAMGTFTRREGISWKNPGFDQNSKHPVVWVDWHDAATFAAWLSGKTGEAYNLPTEAQWEHAAKASGSNRWAGTSEAMKLSDFAWYGENSDSVTHEVGLLEPNGLGIHDLSGNVWEWCLDGYYDYRYAPHTLMDPIVRKGDTRIIRGGSWRVDSPLVTTTYRNGYKPTYSHSSMGFRLVRTVSGKVVGR
jgi:formylglycine-generating enzyme required for sulfatase activity